MLEHRQSLLIALLSIGVSLSPALSALPNPFKDQTLPPNIVFQVGGFSASQGESQDIGIDGLIGDHFTVNDSNDFNYLVGLGYYRPVYQNQTMDVFYGFNGFYLAETEVKGDVEQENLFTNLSYHYSITQYPLYFLGKLVFNTPCDRCKVSLDAGIGPNIIVTSHFRETSLDNGITIPDDIFQGQTNVAFSATAGLGVRLNHLVGPLAMEVGYRFFYLGNGQLEKTSNQVLDNLSTGHSYANAFVFTFST